MCIAICKARLLTFWGDVWQDDQSTERPSVNNCEQQRPPQPPQPPQESSILLHKQKQDFTDQQSTSPGDQLENGNRGNGKASEEVSSTQSANARTSSDRGPAGSTGTSTPSLLSSRQVSSLAEHRSTNA